MGASWLNHTLFSSVSASSLLSLDPSLPALPRAPRCAGILTDVTVGFSGDPDRHRAPFLWNPPIQSEFSQILDWMELLEGESQISQFTFVIPS